MEVDNQFRVGEALLLIHQSIGRGIHMSGLYSRIFVQAGFPGGKMRPGFVDYIRSLTSVLHAHHLAEDKLAFPLLRDLLPEAPYEQLADEHREFTPIVDELRLKIERAVEDPEAGESLERIDSLLAKMWDSWRPHIAVEETYFSPARIDAVMNAEEQIQLLARMSDANQEHSGPDYLVVPFTLFNLPEKDRTYLSGLMPPVVAEHLVPVAWKEKWRPMSPFLLV
ncbi:MAG: hemerythrin domain-containing protein [Candidatus Aminicenantes bacterium]